MPLPLIAFVFGAVTGSFLNVCIYRLPREESIVFPGSRCPACGAAIRWYDNIPILGWLLLKGKCRSCSGRIHWRYPLVELLNALLTTALFYRFGLTAWLPVMFLFSSALVVITFIDLDHRIIPDVISLPGIVIGFIAMSLLFKGAWFWSLTGILAGGGILLAIAAGYEKLTGKEGMGGGDIKLLAMMGAFLGLKAIPFILFVSSLFGSVIGISVMLLQKKDSKLAIPFGPFLAAGALLYVFFGPEIIRWYLSVGRLQ